MGWECRCNKRVNCDKNCRKTGRGSRMFKGIGKALRRFGRGMLSLVIVGSVAGATQEPVLLVFAPFLNALAKWLREKYGLTNLPL